MQLTYYGQPIYVAEDRVTTAVPTKHGGFGPSMKEMTLITLDTGQEILCDEAVQDVINILISLREQWRELR